MSVSGPREIVLCPYPHRTLGVQLPASPCFHHLPHLFLHFREVSGVSLKPSFTSQGRSQTLTLPSLHSAKSSPFHPCKFTVCFLSPHAQAYSLYPGSCFHSVLCDGQRTSDAPMPSELEIQPGWPSSLLFSAAVAVTWILRMSPSAYVIKFNLYPEVFRQ